MTRLSQEETKSRSMLKPALAEELKKLTDGIALYLTDQIEADPG